jgi:copper transport protein
MRARAAAFTLLALALVLPAGAQAHAFLESSTPASGTSLARAPHVVTLRFTEPVSAGLAHVQLFDGRGRLRTGARVGKGRTAGELRVSLPKLATGAYRIAYSTVSQDDLHITRGAIVFGAGAAAPAVGARASAVPPTSISESIAHLLDLVSLSVLIAICSLLAAGLPAAVRARVSRFGLIALPALLLAGVLVVADKAARLPWRDVLAHTAWGHAMLVREAAIAAVAIALATRRPRLALVLLVPVAAAEAAAGHAASLGTLAMLSMTVHILAAGLWAGGLIVLALVLPGVGRPDALSTLARFGRLAAASVAVLLVTGLYSAGLQVTSADALLSTTYGWSLIGKFALLAATGGFGLLGLLAARRLRPSPALLRAEAIAVVGLLAAASLLLASAPARGPQFAPAPRPIVGTALATGQADDLLIDLSTAPNRPGQNFVTATILDTLRPSPGSVRRVVFTFSRASQHVTAPATRLDANRWQVAGTQLSAPGAWRIAVSAERSGLPRATYSTAWTVASPLGALPARHARFSQRPLRPILTALAGVLAGLAALAAGCGVCSRLTLRRPRTA